MVTGIKLTTSNLNQKVSKEDHCMPLHEAERILLATSTLIEVYRTSSSIEVYEYFGFKYQYNKTGT